MGRPKQPAISVWVEQLPEQLLVGREYSVVNLVVPDGDGDQVLGGQVLCWADALKQAD